MASVTRSSIKIPTRRREAVEVEGIGEIIIRQMHLSEMLAITAHQYKPEADATAGESDGAQPDLEAAAEEARAFTIDPARFEETVQVLAWCVIDSKGLPLLSAEEWEIWGAQNYVEACKLIFRVQRLSAPEKKTAAPSSDSPAA